ncbi:MAG: ABC transporter ATP-binding protein [Halobacteriales archaeon]
MTAIQAADVSKTFGDVRALDGLSLSVGTGELYGLLGPNGAGKTTTIRILTGQLVPDTGTVEVRDVDPVAEPVEARRRIGVLPEQASPPSFLTPREYFDFVGTVRDLDDGLVAERVDAWTDRLDFAEKLDTLNTDLSRGQQQKVMITATFLHEPAVVFIDEPLVNLDPIVQERVKRYLEAYVADGNAIFLSTHHIEIAERLCTRVGVVREGRLVAEREPGSLGDGESLLDAFLADVGDAEG